MTSKLSVRDKHDIVQDVEKMLASLTEKVPEPITTGAQALGLYERVMPPGFPKLYDKLKEYGKSFSKALHRSERLKIAVVGIPRINVDDILDEFLLDSTRAERGWRRDRTLAKCFAVQRYQLSDVDRLTSFSLAEMDDDNLAAYGTFNFDAVWIDLPEEMPIPQTMYDHVGIHPTNALWQPLVDYLHAYEREYVRARFCLKYVTHVVGTCNTAGQINRIWPELLTMVANRGSVSAALGQQRASALSDRVDVLTINDVKDKITGTLARAAVIGEVLAGQDRPHLCSVQSAYSNSDNRRWEVR